MHQAKGIYQIPFQLLNGAIAKGFTAIETSFGKSFTYRAKNSNGLIVGVSVSSNMQLVKVLSPYLILNSHYGATRCSCNCLLPASPASFAASVPDVGRASQILLNLKSQEHHPSWCR